MRKLMVIGKTGSGKTTLCQRINEEHIIYKKTQSVELIGNAIDTPGEYLENRSFYKALLVTSVEVDCVILIQDPTDIYCRFAPGIASMFQIPVVGVISKTDIADHCSIDRSKEILLLAGVNKIFCVSSYSCKGIDELKLFLKRGVSRSTDI